MNCPFCKGKGRIFPPELDVEVWPEGLSCDNCSGTGDYETMKLLRAYRLGVSHGYAGAAARVTGAEEFRELSFTTIVAAVLTDVTRQRFEEALLPNSVERKRLERRIEQLERERVPMLRALGDLVNDLRDRYTNRPEFEPFAVIETREQLGKG